MLIHTSGTRLGFGIIMLMIKMGMLVIVSYLGFLLNISVLLDLLLLWCINREVLVLLFVVGDLAFALNLNVLGGISLLNIGDSFDVRGMTFMLDYG